MWKYDPSPNARTDFRAGFVSLQIDVFALEGASKALNGHVVQPPTASVHGNADAVSPRDARKCETGELAALVGVEDIRLSVFRQGFFQD